MKVNFDAPSLLTSLRFVVVAGVMAALMVPLGLVSCVVDERRQYYDEAVASIVRTWGEEQRIAGPVLLIPLEADDAIRRVAPEQTVIIGRAANSGRDRYVAIMPERLEMRLDSRHQLRRLGIFEAPVFDIDITASGRFAAFDAEALEAQFGRLRLDRAAVVVGLSDPRGLREARFQLAGAEVQLSALSAGALAPGLRGALAEAAAGGEFSLSIGLRGSKRISAVPVGDRSRIDMTSSWPHPSFDGRFSPDERDIGDDGFSASWTTFGLARGFAQIVPLDARADIFVDKDLGFRVVEVVTLYRFVERSVKYGVLFVVLTLVSVLCLELATGRRFHVVQYAVAGVGLVLFFLTLLALAEHIGFLAGYLLAAALLTGMIGWYTHGSTGDRRLTLLAVAVLAVLYGVLYTLLRLESFALLVGTAVLLLALAMLMRVTRRLTPESPSAETGEEP